MQRKPGPLNLITLNGLTDVIIFFFQIEVDQKTLQDEKFIIYNQSSSQLSNEKYYLDYLFKVQKM